MSTKVIIVDNIHEERLPKNLLRGRFLKALCGAYLEAAAEEYPGAAVEIDINFPSEETGEIDGLTVTVLEDGATVDSSDATGGTAYDLCEYLSMLAWPLLQNKWLYEEEL